MLCQLIGETFYLLNPRHIQAYRFLTFLCQSCLSTVLSFFFQYDTAPLSPSLQTYKHLVQQRYSLRRSILLTKDESIVHARRAWFFRNRYMIDRCRLRKLEDNSWDWIEENTCISSSGCPSIIINQPSEDPKQDAPYNYNFLRQLELMLTFQKVMIAVAGASSLMAYGI